MRLEIGTFYKHDNGRDAVIMVHDIEQWKLGINIKCSWHLLDYDGTILCPVTYQHGLPIQYVHYIASEDIHKWVRYEA